MDRNRIEGVDTFRVLAILGVIAIHTTPFKEIEGVKCYYYLSILANQCSRFAVSFFFVISGFFYGRKIRDDIFHSYSLTRIKRISFLFLIWSIIYLLPYRIDSIFNYGILGPLKIVYWRILYLADHPIKFLLEGTVVHLWFLNALIFSVVITWLLISLRLERLLIVLSVLLYVVGLLGGAYSATPIGIHLKFSSRDGPFFGTLLFITGYILSKKNVKRSWFLIGSLIAIVGFAFHFGEIYYLWKHYHVSLYQNYVLGTYFMGLGTAMMALSNRVKSKNLSKLGKYTLGIYCLHLILVENMALLDKLLNNPIWEIGYPLIVFVLSTTLVLAMAKNKYMNHIVM